jgi:GDP-L-fucose synthase
MNKEIVIVTGGSGLVGKSIREVVGDLNKKYEFIYLNSGFLDLTNEQETVQYFCKIRPTYVIHLAANVGGLFKNMKYKVEMCDVNMRINMNVLKASHKSGVKKVVSCLSTCIFPDQTEYPIDESMLHNGPPHWSNDAYAYSKRMLEVLSKAYQEEYGCKFVCVIPCNVYGKWDNFSLTDGHVIPALIHRCYLAKRDGTEFVVKGSGKPLRQFIYGEDLARMMLWVLFEYGGMDSLILADEKEWRIGEVAGMIARAFGMEDRLVFDTKGEDGQMKKTASVEKWKSVRGEMGEMKKMEEGVKEVVDWFVENYEKARK